MEWWAWNNLLENSELINLLPYSIKIHLNKAPTLFCKSHASNSNKLFSLFCNVEKKKKLFSTMLKIKLAMCTKKKTHKTI